MLSETIKYEDYNGNEQEKTFYFNISRGEFAKIELGYPGGIEGYLKKVIDEGSGRQIIEFFESIIKDSYGSRSADGTEFVKSEEVFQKFKSTGAYQVLLERVLDNPDYATVFIRGILPGKYQEALRQAEEKQAQAGFRPGAQTLPQSRIDQLKAEEEEAAARKHAEELWDAAGPPIVPEDTQPMAPTAEQIQAASAAGMERGDSVTWGEAVAQPFTPEEFGGEVPTPSPSLNISPAENGALPDDPLLPGERGYEQGLTRRQARELGL